MKKKIPRLLAAALLSGAFLRWQNNSLSGTVLTVARRAVPKGLDGFRIVHLSDLHNTDYGDRLVKAVRRAAPDLIVVTGDLISRRTRDIAPAVRQISACAAFAPVYYVPGNHERRSRRRRALFRDLFAAGVTVLQDERVTLSVRGETLTVAGLRDPVFGGFTARTVEKLCGGGFSLLLCHRPERFRDYALGRADVVFCGHAHGGQVRIPGLGGLVAPGQGYFPKYTGGAHRLGRTTMIVSRGLSGGKFPPRLFNRPEVVTVVLRHKPGGESRP